MIKKLQVDDFGIARFKLVYERLFVQQTRETGPVLFENVIDRVVGAGFELIEERSEIDHRV